MESRRQTSQSRPDSKIVKIPAPKEGSLYALAFTRWVQATSDTDRFATLAAGISGRLYTGLNSAGALETGISTSHTYGMPLIAGSSVKGIARSHAESLGLDKAYLTVLFGDDSDSGSLKSGALVWHDAWFVPASTRPFAAEIITTHHQDYYNGKQPEADEMESPIPNQQIATQGSFYSSLKAHRARNYGQNTPKTCCFKPCRHRAQAAKPHPATAILKRQAKQTKQTKKQNKASATFEKRNSKPWPRNKKPPSLPPCPRISGLSKHGKIKWQRTQI